MRKLPVPLLNPADVFETCVSGVDSDELANRLNSESEYLVTQAVNYQINANLKSLYLFPRATWGNDGQLIVGDVTKGDLTQLYSKQMVKSKKPARHYYDKLINHAPLGICPFCGFGHVSTLDHFLSKAYYPSLSVLPANLVPACRDCNGGKGAGVFTDENQIPHPYFEDPIIETDIWLYARINETSPPTATFEVSSPIGWSDGLKRRVNNYFNDLNLASRFSIQAASELASLSDYLSLLDLEGQIGRHLLLISQSERLHRKNSWKAALYEALSNSIWYQGGGYKA